MKSLSGPNGLTRRDFLKGAATIAGASAFSGMLAACGAAPTPEPTATTAPTGFDWKKYAGTEIAIIGEQVPYNTVVYDHMAEFEKLTGIKVIVDSLPAAHVQEKLLLALSTAPETVDVFAFNPAQRKWKYLAEGYNENLYPFLNDPTLTDPDFDWDDFAEGPIKASSSRDGTRLWMIPTFSGGLPFAYRKDVYEEKGLKVPETLEELENNIAACHDPDNEFYGWATRGKGSAITHTFGVFMRAFGTYYIDEEGNATINSPEMLQAIEYYGRLLREYGPPGPLDLDDAKIITLFGQGLVAHTHLGHSQMLGFCKPEESKVVDTVGWFRAPGGPGGRLDTSGQGGPAINTGSTKKEAAWYLVQWFANKQNQLRLQLAGEPAVRKSAWAAPEFQATLAEGGCLADLLPVLQKIGAEGNPYAHPPAIDFKAARTVVATVVEIAIQGGDFETAADEANAEYQRLIDESGEVLLGDEF